MTQSIEVPSISAAPQVAQPAPAADSVEARLAVMEAQLTRLREERDSAVAEAKEARIEASRKQVSKPIEKLGHGAADAVRDNLIGRMTNSGFYRIAPDERSKMQGGATGISNEELSKFFGKTSSAPEAVRLAQNDPARYRAWRILARERGLM